MLKIWWDNAKRWCRYSLKSNYDGSGKCIKCPSCGKGQFKEEITGTIEHIVCEKNIYCTSCGEYVNFWGYGYYDPCFKFSDPSLQMLWTRLIYRLKGLSSP